MAITVTKMFSTFDDNVNVTEFGKTNIANAISVSNSSAFCSFRRTYDYFSRYQYILGKVSSPGGAIVLSEYSPRNLKHKRVHSTTRGNRIERPYER